MLSHYGDVGQVFRPRHANALRQLASVQSNSGDDAQTIGKAKEGGGKESRRETKERQESICIVFNVDNDDSIDNFGDFVF